MSVVAGIVLIMAVAAAIASPLLGDVAVAGVSADPAERAELLEREKNTALLAIKEADFDLVMGKLSRDDYDSLRGFYEERALGALSELDSMEPAAGGDTSLPAGSPAAFCSACGERFTSGSRFCSGCGAGRPGA